MNLYDAAMSFRAPGQAGLSASETVGELPLDKLVNARQSTERDKLGAKSYAVTLYIEQADFVTTYQAPDPANSIPELLPETYTISLETGPAGATNVQVASFEVTGPGTFVILLDAHTIEKIDPAHAAVALKLTVGGEVPLIKFAAWVV